MIATSEKTTGLKRSEELDDIENKKYRNFERRQKP
jgi:hypothetical protein